MSLLKKFKISYEILHNRHVLYREMFATTPQEVDFYIKELPLTTDNDIVNIMVDNKPYISLLTRKAITL
jgi:hypothetical protein